MLNKKIAALWVLVVSLFFLPSGEGKVYDCFPFYNELEVLTIRLEELWDVVDYFVLVEAEETFTGMKKPLYFKENEERFQKYLSKIIYVCVESHPELDVWPREYYQRNCIIRGLTSCEQNDIILISDVDEIPRASVFDEAKQSILMPGERVRHRKNRRQGKTSAVTLDQDFFYFKLNQWVSKEPVWAGTVVTSYDFLSRHSPQFLRHRKAEFYQIAQGGWHFSWMGGEAMRKLKAVSFSHAGEPIVLLFDENASETEKTLRTVPIDETFPKYVRDNQEYFKSLGYIAD